MSLTIGSAPFGTNPSGTFNFVRQGPTSVLYFEDCPRWIRGVLGDETVVSSRRVKMLHETGLLPVWYFPLEDVREDLLERTERSTHCPFKGEAAYWSIRVGERVVENAAWSYPEPLAGAPPIADHVAFYWEAMDSWYEEDEEVFVHPRDPYHRIDIVRSSRSVRVGVDGVVLAESRRPVILFETGLPPRWYLPESDVGSDLLVASDTVTHCPYKGAASYFSLKSGDGAGTDLVWTYRAPLSGSEKIKDLLCFFDERVDVDVDGERRERPRTRWSPRGRNR